MGSKFEMEFDGFDRLADKLKEIGGPKAKKAVESALKDTHAVVTTAAWAAIGPHYDTGKTEGSLGQSPSIKWESDAASVMVGFHLEKSGVPSIFLMYGTPHVAPDRKLYNAFFGPTVKKEIEEAQRNAMLKELTL